MSHSSVESMTDYNGGSSMEQAVWEHAFWHHFNINGTYPALLRVIVVCFFLNQCESPLSLRYEVCHSDVKVAGVCFCCFYFFVVCFFFCLWLI